MRARSDIVKEEDLGPNVRVVKASDGLGKRDMDPDRLTLVVGVTARSNSRSGIERRIALESALAATTNASCRGTTNCAHRENTS